jgi:hypothetical protein
MKHVLQNFSKDWRIGYRTHYLWITLATVVIFFLFIRFLLPEAYREVTLYHYIDPVFGTASQLEESLEKEMGSDTVIRLDSKEDVYREMEGNSSSYGLIVEPGAEPGAPPRITVVSPGSAEGPWARLVELQVNIGLSLGTDVTEYPTEVPTEILYPELRNLPYRDTFLPIFLVVESSMIGLFLLTVMLFSEKDQQMHTAYLISPGGLSEHLLGKVMVMIVLGLISSFSMTLLLRGFAADYWLLFLTIISSSFMSSSVGLLFGAVFNSLQKAMMVVLVVMILLMMPLISYMFPNFSPLWIRVLPTYSMLFAARGAVIPAYGSAEVYRSALLLAAEGVVLFIIARLVYERTLWANS